MKLPVPFSKFHWQLPAIFLVLIVSILITGLIYYIREQQDFVQEAGQRLGAIADLKVHQIVNWRLERLKDGYLVSDAPLITNQVQAFLARPQSSRAKEPLLSWMSSFQKNGGYDGVYLVDTQGEVRLSAPETVRATLDAVDRALVMEALNTHAVKLSELHRTMLPGARTNAIHFDVLIPLYAAVEHETHGPAETKSSVPAKPVPIGTILFRVNPQDFLFPLIQTWPTPSVSAETLLVRREGEGVLFLNELRYRPGTALSYWVPLSQRDLPSVMAIQGQRGTVEGRDYHGTPVLASVRNIPGSTWFLIVKMDKEEIYAPMRQRARLIFILMGVLVLAAGLGTGLVWQQRENHFTHQKLALAQRIQYLTQQANDIILWLDQDWRILEANERALEAYGYSREELQQLRLPELRAPGSRSEFVQQTAPLATRAGVLFETVHQRKDGACFPIENSLCTVRFAGVLYHQAIIRDISERRHQEEKIRRLNRIYALLTQVNQTIVRVRSREELFRDICQVAIEFGNFRHAWVGWFTGEAQSLTPIAQAGIAPKDFCQVQAAAPAGDQDPVLSSIRQGRPFIVNHLAAEAQSMARNAAALRHGFKSMAVFPLRLRQIVSGALYLYGDEPEIFNEAEIQLLEEVASDLSFALDKLAEEAQRKQAEASLRQHAERLELLSEIDRAILGALSTTAIAESTLKRVRRLIPSQRANIRLFDFEAREALLIACDLDHTSSVVAGARLPLEEAEVAELHLGQVVITPDLDRLGPLTAMLDTLKTEGMRSVLRAPLRVREALIGVLSLAAEQPQTFTPEHAEIAAQVANQIAIAIQQARLYEQTQRHNAELEQRVMERTRQLEEANHELEAFSYSVSHDLRAPLRAIDGFSRILQQDHAAELTETAQRYLHLVREGAERMGQLIDDLLTFSRLSRQPLKKQPVEPKEILRHVLAELRSEPDDRHIEITVGYLPPCEGDPALLRQVFTNLLSNSIKYTRPRAEAIIEVGSLQQDHQRVYYVKDNGVGFDMQYAHKLFGVFQRLHRAEEFEGTGVGLAIVQRIIHRHGGRVWAEAELNQGARFYFTLGNDSAD